MSNVLKAGKKILSVSVAFTTILWSVLGSAFFVLLPTAAAAADCPTLVAGQMIKVTGKPAIYVVNNALKVLYFPSGDEFKSQNVGETYGGYTSVSMACFDSLPLPSVAPLGVNFRSGSYVVKRPSSDQLYVVEPGNTLAKVSDAVAKVLYGASYKVRTVSDTFWPNYVNRGADVTEAKAHPGMLVSNGGKTWYVNQDGTLSEVTAAGMAANRFKAAFVHAVGDAVVAGMAVGSQIAAEVPALSDRTQGGGVLGGAVVPGTAAVSGNLTVSLASDNPFAATVISDATYGAQANVPVLKLNFVADSSGDVVVNKLVLKRSGISADTDVGNMYLYDGATLLASNPSVSNNVVTFSSSAGLFTVSKGTTKGVTVKMDLKNGVTSGKTLVFSVDAAASVGLVSGTAGGSYPLTGNTFTSALVTDLGKLLFANVTPTADGTVDPGNTGFEIWRFKATNTNQDVDVRKLMFTVVGSVNVGDLQNFSLWDGATQIGSTVVNMASDKTVNFDLSTTPFIVSKGQVKNISLKVDVVGGTNRTFRASFQNSADILTYDKNYGVFLKTNGTDSFTIVQPDDGAATPATADFTVNVGTLTQTVASDAPTGNIPDGATTVTLGKFLWKANGEDVKVSSLSVSSTASTQSLDLANVRLLVNGSQVGTTISSLNSDGVTNTGWGSFGNSFIIKAGTSATLTIVADTTNSAVVANDTFIAGLSAGSSNAQGTVSLSNISSVAQNGNTMTVKAGTVTVSKNVAFGDKSSTNPTGTVNSSGVKVSSFVITAGSGENVTVSQITLQDDDTTNCIGDHMQNLVLKDSTGKQLGATYANPSGTCTTRNSYTFNLSPSASIANGGQMAVDVFADLKASLTTADALFRVTTVTASGVSTGSDASSGAITTALQSVYVATAGAFMVQVDPDTSVANNYLMGATDQVIGKFKITASSTEAINITQLVVSSIVSTGATGTMSNIRLIDSDTGLQVGSAVPSFGDDSTTATTTFTHAIFSGLALNIPKGISKVIGVKVDFTTYDAGGFTTTGQVVAPVIMSSYYGVGLTTNNPVTATGASSGTSLTASISGSGQISVYSVQPGAAIAASSTLYRVKLTTAWSGDTPSGSSSPSAAQTVAKFVITNLANAGSYVGLVKWIDFNLSTTISNTASRALTIYKDSLNTTALGTTSYVTNGAQNFGNTAFTDASTTDVSISSGASKTFFITLDTTDAASTKSLSIRIPSAGVHWDDGVSSTGSGSSLTAMGTDLPLLYKTFTY